MFDVNTEHDIFPNPHGNIIQEMLAPSSMITTTSSTDSTTQLLKQTLPFTTSTHTQESYNQQCLDTPGHNLKAEAYQRLISASTSSSPQPIFTPSINLTVYVLDTSINKQHHKHQELK